MPRTCLACSSSEREAIDKALVAGESFRNMAKRFSISPAALFRHKSHAVAKQPKPQSLTGASHATTDSMLPVTLTVDRVGGTAGPQIPQNSGGNKDSVAVEIIGESNGDRSNGRARSLANLEATKFKKGQSGNPAGRPKTKIVRKSLLKHLRLPVAGDTKQLDCVVDSTIRTAIGGGSAGVAAFTVIRDTVDGRPTAADDQSGNTQVTIEITMVGGQ